jgi:hypothetical protein
VCRPCLQSQRIPLTRHRHEGSRYSCQYSNLHLTATDHIRHSTYPCQPRPVSSRRHSNPQRPHPANQPRQHQVRQNQNERIPAPRNLALPPRPRANAKRSHPKPRPTGIRFQNLQRRLLLALKLHHARPLTHHLPRLHLKLHQLHQRRACRLAVRHHVVQSPATKPTGTSQPLSSISGPPT